MNRTRKNIIAVVIAVLLAGCMGFTAYSASSSISGPGNMGQPPQMQSGQGSDDQSSSQNSDQNNQNSEQGQPPQGAPGQSDSDSSSGSSSDNSSSNSNGQPPAPPDSSNNQSSQSGQSSDQSQTPQGQPPQGDPPQGQPPQGEPPQGAPGQSDSSSNSDSGNSSGDSSESNSSASNNSGNTDSDTGTDNGQPQAPPDMNGGSEQGPGTANPGEGGPGQAGSGKASLSSIPAGYYALFGAEGLAFALVILYLIFSNMNSKTMKETFSSRKRLAAFVVAAVLLGGALVPAQAALATTAFAGNTLGQQQMQGGPGEGQPGGSEESAEATGATTVDGTEETLNDTYTSSNADENAILVTNGGTLTSDGATINKESGDSSNTGSSDFSGVNSGLLVQENSTATVKNATIKTSAKGANAVFATGENAKITISDSTIETTGEASSRGLDATYGGTIEADNVKITTQGGSCAAMATDRGEGTVSATDSTLETNGAGSPVIYSTGNITLTDSKGTANGAQITVVEGKNSATIENSEVSCSAAGNRGDVDIAGVMIYQSMSGDADEGTGNFTAKNSKLSISKDSNYYKTAPMFFVTNTDAVIDLTNTDLNFGSGILLNAAGTSEWGQEGSNGGNVTLNAEDQTLKGDITLDEISTLEMNLTGSTYKGAINADNTAKSVTLKLDKDSKITLTGDSYVSSLEDADSSYSNIDFNGYKLYVDGKAIN